jgi:hypothetical protein
MQTLKMKCYSRNGFLRMFLTCLLSGAAILFIASCARTVKVYQPPRLDLAQFGRLGLITFSDNAQPSVADYVTGQFQSRIHSAQAVIPIVELGTKEDVLKRIGSSHLDSAAIEKIGKKYNISALFIGDLVYSDVKNDVNLQDLAAFKASVSATLNATLSVKLIETEGGATIWSDSTSWKRKLGGVSVSQNAGISVGNRGYKDAYKKLVPDMVYDVTRDLRGRYVRKPVNDG